MAQCVPSLDLNLARTDTLAVDVCLRKCAQCVAAAAFVPSSKTYQGILLRYWIVMRSLASYAFPLMTSDLLKERDPDEEVKGWLLRLGKML
jgi:hypothetical protein